MLLRTGAAAAPRRPARPLGRTRGRGLATAVALCAAGLLAAGCGSPDGDGADDRAKRRDTPSSSSASPAASASPASPGRRSSPSASPSPTYKATKDLSTCYDGACTVEVREGTVIPFGDGVRLPDLRIDKVGPSGVDMTASEAGTMLHLGGQSPEQGGPSRLNETDVEVLAIDGDTTVLRISPARG
ncbi:hypothetical protein GCM10010420_38530 [Streptomyces glaucosporus]|uniref:Lipoprotein n=1 Tax=Streptomyces glaucosporus TaxID=284044 RepID=A0ABP5VRQ8_9ACTN